MTEKERAVLGAVVRLLEETLTPDIDSDAADSVVIVAKDLLRDLLI